MLFRKRRRVVPQVNITSLIDVVLLLLIFFMISTTFVTQPGIRVNLPKAATKVNNMAQERNTIVITAENSIYINRQEIRDIQGLRDILKKMRSRDQTDELIVVKADETVAHGVVVSVMDLAKTSGFNRIAIATR
ncbi:biopolymer transporter ExbD [candidate division KSB3 bacterium]|uniref:Biopolymer transporter ExbD n=1 Tax=candidate division KSB3 bacterium TaxID=2044937 RepID=A0A2G6E126_9BACT|nr:MAG: biopolymer transporter ExbD [candidate division KSB3 bacterium]PIE28348.1 MAG: biopolymer transporter ExbD [candidate division KSB3 bacterium]